jgi:hypothetical protein
MRLFPKAVWFSERVTPVASHPKFLAAYVTRVPHPQPISKRLQNKLVMRDRERKKIYVPILGLQIQLSTNDLELIILQLLQRLLLLDIPDDTTRVDHPRTQEPGIEIIAPVVVLADLGEVLVAGVEDDVGDELGEDVFEEGGREVEDGPVVALFHDFEDVACQKEIFKNRTWNGSILNVK